MSFDNFFLYFVPKYPLICPDISPYIRKIKLPIYPSKPICSSLLSTTCKLPMNLCPKSNKVVLPPIKIIFSILQSLISLIM